VVQIVQFTDQVTRNGFLEVARRVEALRHRSLATMIAAGVEGEDVYAAFAVAPEGETLESFLRSPRAIGIGLEQRVAIVLQLCLALEHAHAAGADGPNPLPEFVWITPDLTVQVAGLLGPPDAGQPRSDGDFHAMPAPDGGDALIERRSVHILAAVLVELLTNQRPERASNGEIDLAALLARRLDRPSRAPSRSSMDAQVDDILDAVLRRGTGLPASLAGFRRELEEASTDRDPTQLSMATPASPTAPKQSLPVGVAGHSAPSRAEPTPLVYDEDVQFTVYRPKTLAPGHWYPLLAFAHLSERRSDAPADEPDPSAEVARQAAALLGDTSSYHQASEDSSQRVPREGEITFVPSVPGVEFNPPAQSFFWTESVHRAEFRARAQAVPPASQIFRGRMAVYLGAILLAEINLSFGARAAPSSRPDTVGESARPYRKIFASYSHRDDAIVRQCRNYAKAMGDEYLQDVINLRSGERWAPALEALIRDADIFQLFWSWNSLQSDYVQKEWRYALGLRRTSFIRPVYWDEPLPARDDLPPKDLLDLHFQRIESWSALASSSAPRAASTTVVAAPSIPVPPGPPSMPEAWREPPAQGATPAPAAGSGPEAPPRSGGLNWRVLSAVAALAVVILMVPTLYLRTSSPTPESVTVPRESSPPAGGAPVTVHPAPAVVAPSNSTSLSVTVTTDTGRVLNAEGDGQVQLIDRATNAIVARARLRADGMAEFPSVPPGDYTLAASVPGLELRGEAAVSVAPTAPSTAPKALTLRLRRVR
jgi:hypothetical protein